MDAIDIKKWRITKLRYSFSMQLHFEELIKGNKNVPVPSLNLPIPSPLFYVVEIFLMAHCFAQELGVYYLKHRTLLTIDHRNK